MSYSLLRTSLGRSFYVEGAGRPVLFSSGALGVMPSHIYSTFLSEVCRNCTVMVPVVPEITTPAVIRDVSDALGSRLHLITHSSFDEYVLTSPCIESAVLFDPITLPGERMKAAEISAKCPILAVRAQKTYGRNMPDFNVPRILNDHRVITIPDAGHPDILNDYWADTALSTGLWKGMRGIQRSKYRRQMAKVACSFINKGYNS